MCGLVGMIAKGKYGFQFKDTQMFNQMLYADALRGEDSTGVFGVNKYGNLKMLKSAKPSADFMRTKAYDDFEKKIYSDMQIVIGHNRASTRGATVDENAHPFIEDHICLVHNGTLHSHKELADTTVDSHAICTAISKQGHMEVLPKINGAYALIWYDAKEKKLNIVRNSQRPLWILQTDDTDYIASEPEMLEWIYKRVYGKAPPSTKFFSVEFIYSWDMDDLKSSYKTENVPVKKYQPVQVIPAQQKKLSVLTPAHFSETGTNTSKAPCYTKGQRVVFEHISNSVVGDVVTFHGITCDDIKCSVHATKYIGDMSKVEQADLLDNSEFLEGEYLGQSTPRGNARIFLTNVKEVSYYQTCNNHTVTLQQIANAGHCCHDCGTIIEPEDDDGVFWARVKGGEIKRMLCPTCVSQHPKLAALLKEQDTCTTNESPSLDTNLDPDQYANWQDNWGNW